jgi:hypothetical protein
MNFVWLLGIALVLGGAILAAIAISAGIASFRVLKQFGDEDG